MLPYDSLNLAINTFSSGLLGVWFTVNKVESAAEVGKCCTYNECTSVLFSGFPILQGNAEALNVRWENKASSDFLLSQ